MDNSAYSRHSSLAQLSGDDSDGFRSGHDDDGSDMEIYGGAIIFDLSIQKYLTLPPA
jgi:hypothetical protein